MNLIHWSEYSECRTPVHRSLILRNFHLLLTNNIRRISLLEFIMLCSLYSLINFDNVIAEYNGDMITQHGGGYKHHSIIQELATSANRGCELCSFIDLQMRSSCKEYSPLHGENKHKYYEAYRSGLRIIRICYFNQR